MASYNGVGVALHKCINSIEKQRRKRDVSMNNTAQIAEQKTTADRKKRGRFSLLFSLLVGFR